MPQLIPTDPGYSKGIIFRYPGLNTPTNGSGIAPWDVAECWAGNGALAGAGDSFPSGGAPGVPQGVEVFTPAGKWVQGTQLVAAIGTQFSDRTFGARDQLEAWTLKNAIPGNTYFAIPDSWGPLPSKPCMARIIPYLGVAQYDAGTHVVTWTPLVAGQLPPVTPGTQAIQTGQTVKFIGGQPQVGGSPPKSASQSDIDSLAVSLKALGFSDADASALAKKFLAVLSPGDTVVMLANIIKQCLAISGGKVPTASQTAQCQALVVAASNCPQVLSDAARAGTIDEVLAKGGDICVAAVTATKSATTPASSGTGWLIAGAALSAAGLVYAVAKRGSR